MCRLSCSLFCPLRRKNWKKKKKMSIACWSKLLNCDSALSARHTGVYSTHPLDPSLNCWKSFPLLFTFQLNFPLFFTLPPPSPYQHPLFDTEITSVTFFCLFVCFFLICCTFYLDGLHNNVVDKLVAPLTCRRNNHCSCAPGCHFATDNSHSTNDSKPGAEQLLQLPRDDCRLASLAHAYHNVVLVDRIQAFYCLHCLGIDTNPLVRCCHILRSFDQSFQQLCLPRQGRCSLSILV